MTPLYYLIYVSTATNLMSLEELEELLKQSQRENAKIDITGMLVYKEGCFMQILEGKQETVEILFKKIEGDRRHRGVVKILTGEIGKRNYSDWSMGFCNMDQVDELPRFDAYLSENLELRAFEVDSQSAYRFMTTFISSIR